MIEIITAICGGFLAGWLMGRLDRETQDDPGRRINHENKRGPVGPRPRKWRDVRPIRRDEGRVQRGNGAGGPTTPKPDIILKPQFPSPRVIPGDTP